MPRVMAHLYAFMRWARCVFGCRRCIMVSEPIYPPSEGFPPEDTTTRSEAWTLGDGSVVVLVSGKAGGVHLSHIEVLL